MFLKLSQAYEAGQKIYLISNLPPPMPARCEIMKRTSSQLAENNLTPFDGGIKLTAHKSVSTRASISNITQCDQYVIPLQQHIGVISQVLVKPGEKVLKGQMLAKPGDLVSAAIHSPVSGVVTDITQHAVPHISPPPTPASRLAYSFSAPPQSPAQSPGSSAPPHTYISNRPIPSPPAD